MAATSGDRTTAQSGAIFIGAPARSGSTLLDNMLAAHPDIWSAGELVQLKAYALQTRDYYDPAHPLNCSCGEALSQCPFWREVEATLGTALHELRLSPRFLGRENRPDRERSRLKKAIGRTLSRWPGLYRSPLVHKALAGPRVGADGFRLFRAIHAASDARYVLDSSKMRFRFWSLCQHDPRRTWVILLARDHRAVAYSHARRGAPLLEACSYWTVAMTQMETLSRGLAEDRVIRVRYEDLCAHPEDTIKRLCRFLSLDYVPDMSSPKRSGLHHIGGSPSKFDRARQTVQLDTSYLERIDAADRRRLDEIAGEHARRWGYA